MIELKSIGTPLVLVMAMFALSGCEQAEKSAQQMLNQAAESAKQAIDKTNEAAQQALHDATHGVPENSAAPEGQRKDTSREI
ncbi:hypothetical protein NVV94_09045 [Pseudomonas sp. LS1212]|uniref:hypothetical protein n=1 Tax=Pseudomonas sp. LS1212 TaxID=2972478 RepID=UPI00215D2986|nr:hypothetical protein [Pseudomonas sp. LS1212]UVJ45675.1 hypothetical protein NVV94_09045 [Pseudomonas sp. LS1212]